MSACLAISLPWSQVSERRRISGISGILALIAAANVAAV
ncbi:Uncharacterised protein [Mycobacteroides abscessus subsp. abscessus]|nr:Uncharacterised protein [Mycobacteroides abscessus subsp. abscessus]